MYYKFGKDKVLICLFILNQADSNEFLRIKRKKNLIMKVKHSYKPIDILQKSLSEYLNNSVKKWYFCFTFSGCVEEIFWNRNTKFHMKIITRSKVMKVPVKSCINATEQACSNNCIDLTL